MVIDCIAARYTSTRNRNVRKTNAKTRVVRSVVMIKWWHMAHRSWIDISIGIRNGMPHWPGDPPPRVVRLAEMSKGAVCNVTAIDIPAHTGTHMDAPLHFID